MSAPSLHAIRIIQPASGLGIATVRVSPPRGEPGPPGADGADGPTRTWEDLEGRPATFPPASHTHATGEITGLTASLAAKADLVGGVIPTAQIPAIAISSYLGSVANQAAMLALAGQVGDWCNRSDTSTAWVITGGTPNQISSWAQLSYPASPVTSVNGQTGVIVLGHADVGAVPTAREIITSGLATGGGNLSANRTISVPAASQADVFSGMSTSLAVTPAALRGGIKSLASRVYGVSAALHGYTDPGLPATPGEPPGDLTLTFDEMSFSTAGIAGNQVGLLVDATHRGYAFSLFPGESSDTWINCDGLSMADCVSALRAAMEVDFPGLSFSQPSYSILQIGFPAGSAYSWSAYTAGLVVSASPGSAEGTGGTEEVPPSGDVTLVTLKPYAPGQQMRIMRAWFEGTFAGAMARFAYREGDEFTPVGGWFTAPGELQVLHAPDAFFQLQSEELVAQLSVPYPAASVTARIILSH